MTNAAEVSDSRYKLEIAHDTDPPNPRNGDNLGTMVCWHNRYKLGDDHNFSDTHDLLKSLILDSKTGDDNLIDLEDILEEMGIKDLLILAGSSHLIKPLFLYDHSIQSISTDSFIGRAHHADWDSGQVGVVYVSFDDIKKGYGDVSPESIEQAQTVINAEVKNYDRYLRGECYGFRLIEDGEERDSCFGFLGDFDSAIKDIAEHLPQNAKYLAKNAEYGTCKVAEPKKDLLGRVGKAGSKVAAQTAPAHNQDRKKSAEALE